MCRADTPHPAPLHSPPMLEPASVGEEVRDLDGDTGQGQDRGGQTDGWTQTKREARGWGPRRGWGELGTTRGCLLNFRLFYGSLTVGFLVFLRPQ